MQISMHSLHKIMNPTQASLEIPRDTVWYLANKKPISHRESLNEAYDYVESNFIHDYFCGSQELYNNFYKEVICMEKDNNWEIKQTPKGYTIQTDNHRYFAGHVQPTKGYPDNANHKYKASLSMMKYNPLTRQNDFIKLNSKEDHYRYNAIMDRLCDYIESTKVDK